MRSGYIKNLQGGLKVQSRLLYKIISIVGNNSLDRKYILQIRHGDGVEGSAKVHSHSPRTVEEV